MRFVHSWTRRPVGVPQLNEEFSGKIGFLYTPWMSSKTDALASFKTGSANTSASGGELKVRPGVLGSVAGVNSTSTQGTVWSTSGLLSSTDYTVMAVVLDNAGRGAVRNPFDSDQSVSSRWFQLRFESSNVVGFIPFNTAGTPVVLAGTTTSSSTAPSVIFGRVKSLAATAWLNGKQEASGTLTGTAQQASGSGQYLGVGSMAYVSAYFQPFAGEIYLCAYWARALSDAEIATLSRDPWQLFVGQARSTQFGIASSSSSFTSADGASTTSTLTGASTAQATASSAAGASTALTLTGSSTASATATAAAGSSTASTLVGASTASATASSAAGASTASTMVGGSTSALSSFTQADGASTASTMSGGSISEASIIYASGSSSTATMVGAGSVDTMARPGADVLTTGWHASTGTDLFDMIDEASADDADYIYRDLAGSDPYVFELWLSGVAYSLPAGSHVVRMRADVTAGAAQARLLLLDASDNVVGTGAWQSLTPGLATATFTVDSAASATKGRIEAVAA